MIADTLIPNVYSSDDQLDPREVMSRELVRVGFSVQRLGSIITADCDWGCCWISGTDTSFQSHVAAKILKNKVHSRTLFSRLGLAHAKGRAFRRDQADDARRFVRRLGRAVVKPGDGKQGHGVSVDINSDAFDQAWQNAWSHNQGRVLIEKFFSGEEARYLVIDGRCVAVVRRIPPTIYGDGVSSILQLVEKKNQIRAMNPHLMHKPIDLDPTRLFLLQSRGLDPAYVPAAHEKIVIDRKGNLSTGADSQDITDIASSSYKSLVEDLARVLPGSHAIGIDILATDHTADISENSYIIVEGNTNPDFLGHYYPMFGLRRDVFGILAESCMRHVRNRAEGAGMASSPALLLSEDLRQKLVAA